MLSREDLDDAIRSAARIGAEIALRNAPRERPEQYTFTDAAKKLGRSRQHVACLVRAGELRINGNNKIPASEIDRFLETR
jgi:hypothetical protein